MAVVSNFHPYVGIQLHRSVQRIDSRFFFFFQTTVTDVTWNMLLVAAAVPLVHDGCVVTNFWHDQASVAGMKKKNILTITDCCHLVVPESYFFSQRLQTGRPRRPSAVVFVVRSRAAFLAGAVWLRSCEIFGFCLCGPQDTVTLTV